MLEGLITFGYIICALGLALCCVSYFAIPKMIKVLVKTEEKEDV